MMRIILAILISLAFVSSATGQDSAGEPDTEISAEDLEALQAYMAEAEKILEGVEPDHGHVLLGQASVVMEVPDTLDYYDDQESRTILEELWGNPPDNSVLGMLFPAGESPAMGSWGAAITFENSGYVSDDDAATIDYDELLANMQKETRSANLQRKKLGYPTVDLRGWAKRPDYDAARHHLIWAKDLMFSGEDTETLNYDMRVLGRKGVLSVNFIGTIHDLDGIETAAPEIMDVFAYQPGARYEDYVEGDKVAGYGIAALIAGGTAAVVAKKAGLLAVLLLFLKKGWVILLLGFGAIGRFFKGIFGGKSPD